MFTKRFENCQLTKLWTTGSQLRRNDLLSYALLRLINSLDLFRGFCMFLCLFLIGLIFFFLFNKLRYPKRSWMRHILLGYFYLFYIMVLHLLLFRFVMFVSLFKLVFQLFGVHLFREHQNQLLSLFYFFFCIFVWFLFF